MRLGSYLVAVFSTTWRKNDRQGPRKSHMERGKDDCNEGRERKGGTEIG